MYHSGQVPCIGMGKGSCSPNMHPTIQAWYLEKEKPLFCHSKENLKTKHNFKNLEKYYKELSFFKTSFLSSF